MKQNLIPANGTVHWIGAGLSTGSGLNDIVKRSKECIFWNRNLESAEKLLVKLGLQNRVEIRQYTSENLKQSLKRGDILVSMIPSHYQAEGAEICNLKEAHFVSSSYLNPETSQAAYSAAKKGLVVQLETGLDPGIDHLFSHILVKNCLRETEAANISVKFESFCGGFPAVPNDFCYKFSWAPAGVLRALKSPAQHIEDSKIVKTPAPWLAVKNYKIKEEELECYPNRDSLPYVDIYQFPKHWQIEKFVRGTLRLKGWKTAWREVFQTLEKGSEENLEKLANKLATQYSYQTGDQEKDYDRVLLYVSLAAFEKEQKVWHKAYLLDLLGDNKESAMAKTVSGTVACSVCSILKNETAAGVQLATSNPQKAVQWLDRLACWGVKIHSLSLLD